MVTAEGKVLLEPARGDLRQLRGILKAPRDRRLTLEGIDEVIRRAALPRIAKEPDTLVP